jgi:predicted RNA-binding Zn-ribbon protein involved in translation (DUF1610 family)
LKDVRRRRFRTGAAVLFPFMAVFLPFVVAYPALAPLPGVIGFPAYFVLERRMRRDQARRDRRRNFSDRDVMRLYLPNRCVACGASLAGRPSGPDTCRVCPDCGHAWVFIRSVDELAAIRAARLDLWRRRGGDAPAVYDAME